MFYEQTPPLADPTLLVWAVNISTILTSDPLPFNVTVAQAAQLQTLTDDFQAKLEVANGPGRGPTATLLKDEAKQALLTYARSIAQFIENNPATTNEMRSQLRLHIRKQRTPQQAPTNQPSIDIKSMGATSVSFRAHSGDATVRRLPAGVMGMTVWTFVGDTPPFDYLDWQCQGPFTRPTATIDFDAAVADGGRVWIAACWFNRHGSGPMSLPMDVKLAGRATVSQQMQMQMTPSALPKAA